MKKRLIAFFLGMTLVLPQIFTSFAFAEGEDVYAEVIFGTGGKNSNMSTVHSFVPDNAEGKEGLRSKKASRAEFIYFNINDSVLYNIPDDTPLDIVVEYFDDVAGGQLSLTYDANRPPEKFDIITNNTVYRSTEDVLYLEGSGEWKTHTFHVEDLKAANRLPNATDFRIGIWEPKTGMSPTDVLVHSVKVKKGDYKSAVEVKKVYFDSLGHMYTKGDMLELKVDIRNIFDDTVTVSGNAKISDRYGKKYSDNPFSAELAPKEEKTVIVALENPEWYDLYDVKCTLESIASNNPDKKYLDSFETDFSLSVLLDAESADPDYGNCIQMASKGRGKTPEIVAGISNALGSSYIRDDIGGEVIAWTGTEYVIRGGKLEQWKKLRENGVQACLPL